MYDYLIVGAGLYGSTVAYNLRKIGYSVLVIDKRSHIAGNIYTENIEGINVHKYGAHIFHTSNNKVWDFVNKFATFNNFINMPIANYQGERYHLPFNMNTFTELWNDVKDSEDAKRHIEEDKKGIKTINNLEDQAISLVGTTIYNKLIKGYTEKQWGKKCTELPASIIKRIPVRFTYDNNYFNDDYQGIPIGGYTKMIEKMLEGIDVRLNCDYLEHRDELNNICKKIIYTGPIDEYYDYKYGRLEYRSLRFEEEIVDKNDYQGNAVINYTDSKTPYTRIIEHKYFEFIDNNTKTVITKEYPSSIGDPYYPMNDEKNDSLYNKYLEESKKDNKITFKGRLGLYKYLDMDDVIEDALNYIKEIKDAR